MDQPPEIDALNAAVDKLRSKYGNCVNVGKFEYVTTEESKHDVGGTQYTITRGTAISKRTKIYVLMFAHYILTKAWICTNEPTECIDGGTEDVDNKKCTEISKRIGAIAEHLGEHGLRQ